MKTLSIFSCSSYAWFALVTSEKLIIIFKYKQNEFGVWIIDIKFYVYLEKFGEYRQNQQ